jgi:ABC-type transport system involved in multi-copper enzyme maturation permease subunit
VAIYKRGYQRYQGPCTPHLTRLLAFPRFAWRRMVNQRLVVIVLMASLFWPLACAAFVYISNHTELLQGVGGPLVHFLNINGTFFLTFMSAQSFFAVLLAALAGPGLVAPDLANNALPLYFSRPLSRLDYVLARLLVLAGLLALVTWIPGLLLFGMQIGMAGWSWFAANWTLGAAVAGGFFLWSLLLGLVAMASSAYVRWRVIAGALVLAFFFVLAGAAQLIKAVTGAEWALALNPGEAMNRIWSVMLGVELKPGPGALECAVSLGVMVLLLCWILERKLRPAEVVS